MIIITSPWLDVPVVPGIAPIVLAGGERLASPRAGNDNRAPAPRDDPSAGAVRRRDPPP